jgi:Spy/CpxP family protein refolding chaperone
MKSSRLIVAAMLLAGTTASFAAAHMNKMNMDTNGDGMVSKQEYISHHEAMFDKMDKGGKGMVPMKDMEMSMRSDRAARAETMKSNERARKGEGAATPAPANK